MVIRDVFPMILRCSKWFSVSCLSVNEDKCYSVIYGCHQIADYNYLGGSNKRRISYKHLGIHFDHKLKFSDHIRKVKNFSEFDVVVYKARNIFV